MAKKQKTLDLEVKFQDEIITFGKFKGLQVADVPPDYLLMILKENTFKAKLREYVKSPEFLYHITRHLNKDIVCDAT